MSPLSPDPTPTIERDANGDLLCPLDVVETRQHTLNDPDDEHYDGSEAGPPWLEEWISTRTPCRSPLWVNYAGNLPLAYCEGEPHTIEQGGFICSSWSIECENGHVLARSSADETAEPVHAAVLRGWAPSGEEHE